MHRETRCILPARSELGKEAPLGPPHAGGYCVHWGLQFIPLVRRIFESRSLCVYFMYEVMGVHMEVRGGHRVSSSITPSWVFWDRVSPLIWSSLIQQAFCAMCYCWELLTKSKWNEWLRITWPTSQTLYLLLKRIHLPRGGSRAMDYPLPAGSTHTLASLTWQPYDWYLWIYLM